jgi:hypothetical protein
MIFPCRLSAAISSTRCGFLTSTNVGEGAPFYPLGDDGTDRIDVHARLHCRPGD